MRNTYQYPITFEEAIKAIDEARENYHSLMLLGDVRGYATSLVQKFLIENEDQLEKFLTRECTKTLKTIDEHNEEMQHKYHLVKQTELLTGIECPSCKTELRYNDNSILMSRPPQKHVKCTKCTYRGSVIV